MSGPQVAVVGVVRRRQGLGEHLTRQLVAAGATVPAFVASREETIDEGRAVLLRHGIEAQGYTSLEELLEHHAVEALVIASPAPTHADYLTHARSAGLHVLCEKPLVWEVADPATEARRIVDEYEGAGLMLWENVQWPLTLPAYQQLHPGTSDHALRHFEMWLAPAGTGVSMLIDAMSHPLSVLQALLPGCSGPIEGLCFSTRDRGAARLEASFRAGSAERSVAVRVRLESQPAQPRPAGYALNGLAAERRVRMEDYSIAFEHAGRSVPVPDPMARLVADFVAALSGEPADAGVAAGADVVWRTEALTEIVRAFENVS